MQLVSQKRKWTEGLTRAALIGGIVFFGFIFPDSLSDHEKMLHFAAHVGMSFFLASCLYVLCNIKFRIPKRRSLIILVVVTLVIGAIYKYVEISDLGMLHAYSLSQLLVATGCYTSMSQNITGLLAAILLIEYVASFLKNKVIFLSPLRKSYGA